MKNSDKGICCIDEFDKMSDTTRAVLHEVMEQQTVSVAKAGIIATLNARTTILAAANPTGSIYDEKKSIVQNISLPPTLLSRFDLIFIMRDIPDRERDGALGAHLVSLYFEDAESRNFFGDEEDYSNDDMSEDDEEKHDSENEDLTAEEKPKKKKLEKKVKKEHVRNAKKDKNFIDRDLLTKYIAYSRQICNPRMTDQAAKEVCDHYLKMRQKSKKNVSATTRQLESIIRISEAYAKMRLSLSVDKVDVARAVNLLEVSVFKAAVNPASGEVDIDQFNEHNNSVLEEEDEAAESAENNEPKSDTPESMDI